MRRLAGCGRQFVGHMLPTMPSTVYLQPSCIMTAHSDRISVLHRKFGYLLESDWNSQNSQSGNQSSYSTRIGISIALLVYMLYTWYSCDAGLWVPKTRTDAGRRDCDSDVARSFTMLMSHDEKVLYAYEDVVGYER